MNLFDELQRTAAKNHWKKIGSNNHHGLVIFLPGLRSRQTLSIGEFSDLIPIIDWCASLGLDIVQLLPINDTGLDKSPYNPISAFALNPGYLTLPAPETKQQKEIYSQLAALKSGRYFNYEKNYLLKERYLKKCHPEKLCGQERLEQFIRSNPWVIGHSVFKVIKTRKKWSTWESWNVAFSGEISIDDIPKKLLKDVLFHCRVQYICRQQMLSVKSFAEKKGVLIKGDIPILISPESADVWLNKKLFNLKYSAGAPPDMYSLKGQYWGFPTFNWEDEEKDLMNWWKLRLKCAENYFHLYRIDHVVGLFRLWSIPRGKRAINGIFVPEERKEWMAQGKKILNHFLKSTTMLPIAEDLGLVPEDVKLFLQSIGIPGTKVLRWEKAEDGSLFDPLHYPPISMTTLSTHDCETLIDWWKQYPDEAKSVSDYFGWKYRSHLSREKNKELIELSHRSSSLFHINLLQDYFPLVPKFSWSGQRGDRINIPGKVGKRNWRYRYRPSVEEIVSNKLLCSVITQSIGIN